MVADCNISYIFANTLDDTSSFVSQNGGKFSLGVLARKCVGIGVAKSARNYLHSDFPCSWGIHLYFFN